MGKTLEQVNNTTIKVIVDVANVTGLLSITFAVQVLLLRNVRKTVKI